jgi:predicted transposase/invertase (TIGR01784 family)
MIFGEYDREKDIAVNRREAWENGRAEGMEKGRKEGREEGKLLIARNLLNKGSTPEFVNEVTGLPPEKINLIVDSN